MARFGVALALLLTPPSVQSFHNFQPQSLSHIREKLVSRQATDKVQRGVSASSSGSAEFVSNIDTLNEALNTVTNAARDSIAEAVSDEPDSDEAEIALKQRMVGERVQTYSVTLPLASKKGKSEVLSIGLTLSQIRRGRVIDSNALNLDTLQFDENDGSKESDGVEKMDEATLLRRVDGEFQGLVVSSVVEGSSAWVAGVRAGDLLRTTSATVGSNLWPKSTLEGVRSAILSRKATSGSIQVEFQRLGEIVDNHFELTLSRPIGLELAETEDGYIEVTGFTQNAPTLVQYAVKVGDRVLAVDSSLGGKMWPVSTVDGVISAVTSRLPGQQITFRFERPYANMNIDSTDEQMVGAARASTITKISTGAASAPALGQKELLKRCRGIIKRYMADEQAKDKFVNKYSVPGLVADKVMDALASAGARVDCVTLSMIMGAYLSCQQPRKAIEAFEAIVGLNANGSGDEATTKLEVKDGMSVIANTEALDVYTVSTLLKAHAMNGDMSSVRRVLAAVEGKGGSDVNGLNVASWPGTGTGGVLNPDSQCYNIAMSAAVDSKAEDGLTLALEIFDGMSEPTRQNNEYVTKDLVSYNTIINALTSSGRYDEAIDLFYSMLKVGVKPDKFSYTPLVKAVVATGDVEELLYDMREKGVTPDVITFNTAIKELCMQRNLITAKKIVIIMEESGVAPNSMTYGLLMNGLLRAGSPSASLTLFESACVDQRTVALTENVYLYTTAITAAASLGDYERALDLLSRMTASGVNPTLKTMTALMGACLAAGRPDLAVDIYKKIRKPDDYAMAQGLRAMCESGGIEEALSLISKQGGPSDMLKGKQLMIAYKSMIETSLRRGEYELAQQALTSLMSKGHIPSKEIYLSIFESMNLFPKTIRGMGPVKVSDEDGIVKFRFLLSILDSISERNLPCEGPLYSSILSYGLRLGGLPKRIASLLVLTAQRYDIASRRKNKIIDEGKKKETVLVSTWVELFERYDELKNSVTDPSLLPKLIVRVVSRDMAKVLRAEKGLPIRKRVRRAEV